MSYMNTTYQNQQKQTALITGASSGIGYELACIFAEDGYNLVLVDKQKEKLIQIAQEFPQKFGIYVKIIAKDLSKPISREEIFTELQQASIKVDVLVNNAGFGTYGLFHQTDINAELDMIQVNAACVIHLTKLFVKDMVKQGYGRILNVASTAAFQPGPMMAVYFATKAYVLSFSEAIANELEGTGVTVTVLCPGPTATGFQQAAAMEEAKIASSGRMMDTRTVAEIGYRGLMAKKTVVIPGIRNKILAQSIRFSPSRKLVAKIVRDMHEAKNK
jgi:short-subunit dehydrogenase